LKVAGRIGVSLIEDMAEIPKIAVAEIAFSGSGGGREPLNHPLADKVTG